MTKETEDRIRHDLEGGHTNIFHAHVRELFEDWERLKHMEDERGLDEPAPLNTEGVYE